MGSWGAKAFESDSALGWLSELKTGGVGLLRDTLARVADADPDDEVDGDDGAAAIAAAELVAAGLGHGRDRLVIAANAWLDRHGNELAQEDLVLANRAVNRVLSGASELRDLWEEAGPATEWHADVQVLFERLGGKGHETDPALTGTTRSGSARVNERDKQVLLTFLQARGLDPTPRQLARIRAAQDPTEIRRWLGRAVDAPTIDAILDG